MYSRNSRARHGMLALLTFVIAFANAPEARAETFNLQAYYFCESTAPFCGYSSLQALNAGLISRVEEMNLEYAAAGISYRPLPPIVTVDDRLASLTNRGDDALNGFKNQDLKVDIRNIVSSNTTDVILVLAPNVQVCSNGIPCPSDPVGFGGDDFVICGPMSAGETYAHEFGHYWCLRHTFSFADGSGQNIDHDYDATVCTELGLIDDTPGDPGVQEGSDTDDNGNPLAWREWCDTASIAPDPGSPKSTACSVTCYQQAFGQTLVTAESPFPHNAMSYYPDSCRGPVDVGGQRMNAFSPDQIAVMHACMAVIPERLTLADACAAFGGDYDNDGWCNGEDVCGTIPNTVIVDSDNDGIPNECDNCPNVPNSDQDDLDGNGEGDACDGNIDGDYCPNSTDLDDYNDKQVAGYEYFINCPQQGAPIYYSESIDTDGDGLMNCEDPDDDNDGIPDTDDPCPTTSASSCVEFGRVCPFIGEFFDCRIAGCHEWWVRLLDPWVNPAEQVLGFHVISASEREVILAPMEMDLYEAAFYLAGTEDRTTSTPEDLMRLEIMRVEGEYAGELSVYHPSNARVSFDELSRAIERGANALRLEFHEGFSTFIVEGVEVEMEEMFSKRR